jgi:F420-non-reducing hydrogenase iron-sulfur subunit
MKKTNTDKNIAIFFCQQIDKNQDTNRRSIEKEFGSQIRFFPIPCSGRIEPLHLMRALESGAERVYVITCPEGACRYREGNIRARKRLIYAQGLIEEIGLERGMLELVHLKVGNTLTIDKLTRDLIAK